MSKDDWSVNKTTGVVKHVSGLILSMKDGELMNIEYLPPSLSTRQLPILIDEALLVYNNSNNNITPQSPVYVPKKAILSLKK